MTTMQAASPPLAVRLYSLTVLHVNFLLINCITASAALFHCFLTKKVVKLNTENLENVTKYRAQK